MDTQGKTNDPNQLAYESGQAVDSNWSNLSQYLGANGRLSGQAINDFKYAVRQIR